jgi:site-specific recombinase XerC
MRRFCRWLVTEGELEVAPTDGIEIATPPDEPVPLLPDDDITALLKVCRGPWRAWRVQPDRRRRPAR